MHRSGSSRTWCSQNRKTCQPSFRSRRLTVVSRLLLPRIFLFQKERLEEGIVRQRLHPCQKHPSTKTATFSRSKAKSGLPSTSFAFMRQPDNLAAISLLLNRCSVDRVPLPLFFDMIEERFSFEKTSVILRIECGSAGIAHVL